MTMTALEQLADCEAQAIAAASRPSEIRAEYRALEREVLTSRQTLADLFMQGERGEAVDQEAERVRKALAKSEDKLATERWEERILGAEQAARRAQSDVYGFIEENLEVILAELEPIALAAHAGVSDAIDRLEQALADWSQVAGRVTTVLHLARRDDARPLPHPVEYVMAELRRAREAAAPPTPRAKVMLESSPEEVAA